MNKKCEDKKCHKTSIGGQAVIEGVMMRGPKKSAISVRKSSGEIVTKTSDVSSVLQKSKILKLPIIRGVISFFESLITGTKALMFSAELADIEDDEYKEKKKNMTEEEILKQEKKQGKMMTLAIWGSVFVSLAFSVGLFMLLPAFLVGLLKDFLFPSIPNIYATLLEGIIRITIFIIYIFLSSLLKDIRRVFEYHGAEHKTIFCYESGEELTVENARKFSRLHPRCGTSFLIIVMVVSIIVFSFISWDNPWTRLVLRLLLLPVVAGISYEFIKLCGRSSGLFSRIVSAPGKWLQKITTKEPDDSQLEVAIASLKAVIPENKEEAKW
ncbi:MAG: DUF1385 domain-containing protein [Ruminococcaceae bacterium]|nr:DUF1385 domain-containing protein [Oscillospiraceae bacterium]